MNSVFPRRYGFYSLIAGVVFLLTSCSSNQSVKFTSHLPPGIHRVWIGPEYWANPLQDWQLNDGRIECVASGGDRNVFLLTREITSDKGSFEVSARMDALTEADEPLDPGWVGFKVGVRGDFQDYRDNAVRGQGFPVGITTSGQLFIGQLDSTDTQRINEVKSLKIRVNVKPENDKYRIFLKVTDLISGENSSIDRLVNDDWLTGGVAITCSFGKVPETPELRPETIYGNWGFKPGTRRGGNVRFAFSDWTVRGDKVVSKPEQAWGPVLFTQYTLSKQVLKLTAQMAPVGDQDDAEAVLEIKKSGEWREIARAVIDSLSRTATFRVASWGFSNEDIPYRVSYLCYSGKSKKQACYFEGTIRRVPWNKEELVVAAFTGNNDLGFPNNDIFRQVKYQDPDFLFFSGDQIYEGVGGYGTQIKPVEKAVLDYLRKWYLFGWAYRDLLKNRPSVAIPDDHDMYHGNIWGAGGIATPPGLRGAAAQDRGGYKMPPEWVNMVQRTQTSHLPDPADPRPVAQGIGVYFTAMNYAGVSFAILEDRKFKSAPAVLLPKAKIINGWAKNFSFDASKSADVPGAILLGDRQLNFLAQWAADWRDSIWMKVALSQTIFANVATLPENEAHTDANVPRLRIMHAGEYAPDDVRVQDFDSDAWPQTGRNKALKELRKGFAFHIAGDQHLGSTIQYGMDNWRDAGYAFCVPAISNVWPRRWYPRDGGKNQIPGQPKYTGDFKDGFGNKITVYAVSNPVFTGKKPSRLYDRATGYGIIRINRNTRNVVFECWPRLADPSKPDARQYPGWPVQFNQLDNAFGDARFALPEIRVKNMKDPVIQVIRSSTGEKVFTLRIKGNSFQPRVEKPGTYNIWVGEQGTKKWKKIENIRAAKLPVDKTTEVSF
ncbi:MAG: alkaline phosphatase D family protein [Bacteroidales bacterium]|nr:alkaline phosphatase D family protein [Bacteroidales bacterium]